MCYFMERLLSWYEFINLYLFILDVYSGRVGGGQRCSSVHS